MLNVPVKKLINQVIECVSFLSPLKNDFYKRNVKYTTYDYAVGIIDVLKNSVSWNSYNGIIDGNTLRKKHNEWVKLGVYEKLHKDAVTKYLKKGKRSELKTLSIDSTFVEKKGSSKIASPSGVYKCKKGQAAVGISITSVVTEKGMPISVNIDGANKNDITLLKKAFDNCVIECNTKKYVLADKGYDSKKNHNILTGKGYIPLIPQNRRNIKDPKKIRKMSMRHKKNFKKRHIVENYHAWIKKFRKINYLYETNTENYRGLLLLGISLIVNRRMHNET
jgi:transposase